jgi:Flp pilus assembly secretin CpaC
MPHLRKILALTLTTTLFAFTAAALADDGGPINVKVNMARILRISAPAATIIIGNPGVADVTIQDPQTLVLTGKSYGQTNLIVLDKTGNPIADTLIEVVQQQADLLTMYQGIKRQSLACAPTCQPVIMLGDDAEYASANVGSATTVTSNLK